MQHYETSDETCDVDILANNQPLLIFIIVLIIFIFLNKLRNCRNDIQLDVSLMMFNIS